MENFKEQYEKAAARILELERENRLLRQRLGLSDDEPVRPARVDTQSAPSKKPAPVVSSSDGFNKYRSPQEKIALFRSLFSGREDVFARRWQSAKTGKSGYSPVCSNEWEPGVCPKPKGSCASCTQRQLVPLSDAAIDRHLRGRDTLGRDVVGVYPILPDDTCRFLALDFDDESWQEETALLRVICESWELPCAVERSRSGLPL